MLRYETQKELLSDVLKKFYENLTGELQALFLVEFYNEYLSHKQKQLINTNSKSSLLSFFKSKKSQKEILRDHLLKQNKSDRDIENIFSKYEAVYKKSYQDNKPYRIFEIFSPEKAAAYFDVVKETFSLEPNNEKSFKDFSEVMSRLYRGGRTYTSDSVMGRNEFELLRNKYLDRASFYAGNIAVSNGISRIMSSRSIKYNEEYLGVYGKMQQQLVKSHDGNVELKKFIERVSQVNDFESKLDMYLHEDLSKCFTDDAKTKQEILARLQEQSIQAAADLDKTFPNDLKDTIKNHTARFVTAANEVIASVKNNNVSQSKI